MGEATASERSYTLREAAERLGVSARTVRRYVRSGQLEAVQAVGLHGPEYRVPEAALEAHTDRLATVGTATVRPRVVTAATATVDTLAMLATELEAQRTASREGWLRAEEAWRRIAELEAEVARLRAQLPAGTERRSWLARLRGR